MEQPKGVLFYSYHSITSFPGWHDISHRNKRLQNFHTSFAIPFPVRMGWKQSRAPPPSRGEPHLTVQFLHLHVPHAALNNNDKILEKDPRWAWESPGIHRSNEKKNQLGRTFFHSGFNLSMIIIIIRNWYNVWCRFVTGFEERSGFRVRVGFPSSDVGFLRLQI